MRYPSFKTKPMTATQVAAVWPSSGDALIDRRLVKIVDEAKPETAVAPDTPQPLAAPDGCSPLASPAKSTSAELIGRTPRGDA